MLAPSVGVTYLRAIECVVRDSRVALDVVKARIIVEAEVSFEHFSYVVGLTIEFDQAVGRIRQVDRDIGGKNASVTEAFVSVVGHVEEQLLTVFELIRDVFGLATRCLGKLGEC